MATQTPARPVPEDADRVEVERALSRQRGLTNLSRLQSLGITFIVLGALTAALLARTMPPDDKTFVFGLGDGAPRVTLDPSNAVLAIGVLFVVAGVIALFDRWTGRYAVIALIVAAVLFVPLALITSMGLSATEDTNLLPLLTESLRLGTPVALGAAAGLWSERSGVVNIGIEGMMLAAAGIGFVVYALLNGAQGGLPLYLSVVVAVAVGGLFAALHALLSVSFRTDQIVSGVVINLLAIGLTSFLRSQLLVPIGVSSGTTLPVISLPLLSEIPLVGQTLFSGKPIYFTMFVVFILSAVVLYRTPWGLRVRSVGENPRAAETLGINVVRVRYQAVILGGLLAGLGGAWFSLETVGSFDDLMTNGTGFIALAALIFGKWRPWGAFGGAMLFGFSQALSSRIALLNVDIGGYPIPSQALQALPYIVTIVVLAGAIGHARPPAAVGIPYEKPS